HPWAGSERLASPVSYSHGIRRVGGLSLSLALLRESCMVEPLNTVGIEQAITTLEARVGCSWGNIRASANAANVERGSIAAMLLSKGLVPADCSFVVYGSLARAEVTPGSDVDWTLLVDGQADPQHVAISHAITASLDDLGKQGPGATAVFGGLTF